jgi:hypothetical protein
MGEYQISGPTGQLFERGGEENHWPVGPDINFYLVPVSQGVALGWANPGPSARVNSPKYFPLTSCVPVQSQYCDPGFRIRIRFGFGFRKVKGRPARFLCTSLPFLSIPSAQPRPLVAAFQCFLLKSARRVPRPSFRTSPARYRRSGVFPCPPRRHGADRAGPSSSRP